MAVESLHDRPEMLRQEGEPREVNAESGARHHVVDVDQAPPGSVKDESDTAAMRNGFPYATTSCHVDDAVNPFPEPPRAAGPKDLPCLQDPGALGEHAEGVRAVEEGTAPALT